jgi:galacturan 1,4-alpha-galacturonidase
MRVFTFAVLTAAASSVSAIKHCHVKALNNGQDDGPNILAAFKQCSKNARIKMDGFYSVDTLLLTTGLENVEILLTGYR